MKLDVNITGCSIYGPGGPVVSIPGVQCFDQGSVPGQETEIPKGHTVYKKDEILFKTKDRVGMKGLGEGGDGDQRLRGKIQNLISFIH